MDSRVVEVLKQLRFLQCISMCLIVVLDLKITFVQRLANSTQGVLLVKKFCLLSWIAM